LVRKEFLEYRELPVHKVLRVQQVPRVHEALPVQQGLQVLVVPRCWQ
jgi:hypothetical protein